jgi:predicted nucleotidyltransferase component of viral defense system
MQEDYYQNTLYPLQDKVLELVGKLSVGFYLTGGTALSRAYLHHRYSDDLDFFVNGVSNFKLQVNTVIKALDDAGKRIDISVADDGFARIFVFDGENSLKLDFVNDVPFRSGTSICTPFFKNTDNLNNILSNKVTALGRYSTKDIVDIVYICESHKFNWEMIMNDASEKDLWVNPVNVVEVLEQFPVEKLQEINWMRESPTHQWFNARINQIIPDILDGSENSLHMGDE